MKIGIATRVLTDGLDTSGGLADPDTASAPGFINEKTIWKDVSLTDTFNPYGHSHENIICNSQQPNPDPHR